MTETQALEVVLRSCRRSAADVHRSMMRRVTSLATVASAAPLVGVFGTILGIVSSFKGIGMEKSAVLAMEAAGLSDALAPCAFGLMVAILSFCFYKYLCHQIEDFDVAMENTALELVNHLSVYLDRPSHTA